MKCVFQHLFTEKYTSITGNLNIFCDLDCLSIYFFIFFYIYPERLNPGLSTFFIRYNQISEDLKKTPLIGYTLFKGSNPDPPLQLDPIFRIRIHVFFKVWIQIHFIRDQFRVNAFSQVQGFPVFYFYSVQSIKYSYTKFLVYCLHKKRVKKGNYLMQNYDK